MVASLGRATSWNKRKLPLLSARRSPALAELAGRATRPSSARLPPLGSTLDGLQAWRDPAQGDPKTIHHRGYGALVVDGETIKLESEKP